MAQGLDDGDAHDGDERLNDACGQDARVESLREGERVRDLGEADWRGAPGSAAGAATSSQHTTAAMVATTSARN